MFFIYSFLILPCTSSLCSLCTIKHNRTYQSCRLTFFPMFAIILNCGYQVQISTCFNMLRAKCLFLVVTLSCVISCLLKLRSGQGLSSCFFFLILPCTSTLCSLCIIVPTNVTHECISSCFLIPIIKHVMSAHLHHDVANTQMQTHAMSSSSSITFVICFVLFRYKSVCSWAYFSHFCVHLPTVFQRLSLNTHGMLQMCRLWMHLTHHTSAASLFMPTLPVSTFLILVSYHFWLFGISKWLSGNSDLIQ